MLCVALLPIVSNFAVALRGSHALTPTADCQAVPRALTLGPPSGMLLPLRDQGSNALVWTSTCRSSSYSLDVVWLQLRMSS
jgi:hypothetical protein